MILTTLKEPDYNITDYYFVGGFNPLFKNVTEYWGASDKEYASPNIFYSKLILQFEVFNNFFVSGVANYVDVQYPMEILYDITVGDYLGGEKRRFGYGLQLGYNSPIGPISVSLATDTKLKETKANINVGFWYR